MAFITDLHEWKIEQIAGTDNWINETELVYHSKLFDRTITIPAGYITDLASIPKAFRWFMHPASKYIRAASLPHDYIYTHLYKEFTKLEADQILREAMGHVVCPAPMWKRNIVYLAVRIGGKGNW